MGINNKDYKIIELYDRGFKLKTIAKRLGYEGNATDKGIERVKEGLRKWGYKI
jgi:hypothetical protein